MRTRKAVATTVLGLATAAALTIACSKDESSGDGNGGGNAPPATTEARGDATRASAATASQYLAKANTSGNNLVDPTTRSNLRALYAQARTQARGLKAFQDPTDGGAFDLCTLINSGCEDQLNQQLPADEFGAACKTTSCTNGTTMSCTSPSQTSECKGVTYTMSESTSTMTTSCTSSGQGLITFGIAMDFAGSLSGGSITTPVALACKISLSMAFDVANPGTGEGEGAEDDAAELSCEAGQFTCTIGGQPLSCEDLKKAISEDQCKA